MATKITKKIQYATLWSVFIRLLVHFVGSLGPQFSFLSLQNPNLPSIALWSYGKVQPVATSGITLYQQFVEWLLRLIADVQQDDSIAKQLLHAQHSDVYGTPPSPYPPDRCPHPSSSHLSPIS